MKMDTSRERICDILLIDTSDLVALGLRNCHNTTDECIVDVINCCPKLSSIDLGSCIQVTDVGVSALAAGCSQLQSIILRGCQKVTDEGISALGAGCGQLESIDLAQCKVTDASISALVVVNCRASFLAAALRCQMQVSQRWVQDVVTCGALTLHAVR
jgi:F-box and leucine-rich repeat protein 2/20